jgi:hypothetical protein
MDSEAMQRLIGKALAANGEVEAALNELDGAPPSVQRRITRMIIATDHETDSEGSNDAAVELESMIVNGLSVRFSKAARASWADGDMIIVRVMIIDDGVDGARVAGYGATMWDAAINLAIAAGYYTPADF